MGAAVEVMEAALVEEVVMEAVAAVAAVVVVVIVVLVAMVAVVCKCLLVSSYRT
jgi:hypothetical protein